MSEGSVTRWIDELKAGNPRGAQKLWERYFQRLVGLARKKLQGARRGVADEEDVALSAFDSFCRGAEAGRFPQLDDRHNLWHLLVVLTVRKAGRLVRDEGRQKRAASVTASADTSGSQADDSGPEQFLSREPTPEFAAQVAEEYQILLRRLADRELEMVAVWKMEGYTNEEIAAKVDCTVRTVERKLRIIRGLWQKEGKESRK
jgi:DNA-directed RNA polymerase specialized sigma24 family protein